MADGSTAPRTPARVAGTVPDGHVLSEAEVEAVRGLARTWLQRVHATGAAVGPADDEERLALLIALEGAATADAVARVRGTFANSRPEETAPRPAASISRRRKALEHAAAAWGARVGSPTLVVDQLLLLRHLVTASPDGERIGRLVDKAMVVATASATDELQLAAFTDPLTACANRRAFERDLARELARCVRAELDLTVVAIDVDGLKAVNDTEGHAAGDRILVDLVQTLRRALRSPDGIYRIGGDEFAVVLPDTGADDAGVVLARVVRMGAPSFSWGLASFQDTGCTDPGMLLAIADEGLYEHRRATRGGGRERSRDATPA